MFLRCAAVVIAIAFSCARLATADEISNIVTWPSGPAILKTGEPVMVTLRYEITTPRGARIVVEPMRGGTAVRGARPGTSRPMRGRGKTSIRLTLRQPGEIDGLRVRILQEGHTRPRLEQRLPLRLRFADAPLGVGRPLLQLEGLSGVLEAEIPDRSVRPLVTADALREVLDSGVLLRPTPRLPDQLTMPDGNVVLRQTVMSPPPPYDAGGPDATWLQQLDQWLFFMAIAMEFDIRRLIGDDAAFEEFKAQEAAETSSIYQTLQYRRHTIGRLLDEM